MLGVVGRPGDGYVGRGWPGMPGRDAGVPGRPAPAAGFVATGGVAAGGCTILGCETAGRFAGVSGRAGVVGLPGSSMRRRSVGGTTRGGACDSGGASGAGAGSSTVAAGAAAIGAGSTAGGGGSTRAGSGAGATSAAGASAGAAAAAGPSSTAAGAAAGCAGLIVLTRRGGPRTGAVGFAGSGFFAAVVVFFALLPGFTGAAVSANMSPLGSEMPRCRATRSTNDRATTSSIVLDALFSSMP